MAIWRVGMMVAAMAVLLHACDEDDSQTLSAATSGLTASESFQVCPSTAGEVDPGVEQAPACDIAQFDVFTNLAYGTHAAHLLDLYKPRNPTAPLPTIVWIHGGGWHSGDKRNVQQVQRLVCVGYAVASINYRLSGEAIFPAQIYDVKAAIRFLRANASAYELDAERFAVFGSSAGGHLASLAGTSGGVSDLEDPSIGSAQASSRVQAVVDWYGPIDLSQMDAQAAQIGCTQLDHNAPDSAESRLLGCAVGEPSCAAAVRRANPIEYIDANDPPVLVMHGSNDCTVPRGQSMLLHSSLANAGVCSHLRIVPGAGHGGETWFTVPVQDAVAQFLNAALSVNR